MIRHNDVLFMLAEDLQNTKDVLAETQKDLKALRRTVMDLLKALQGK